AFSNFLNRPSTVLWSFLRRVTASMHPCLPASDVRKPPDACSRFSTDGPMDPLSKCSDKGKPAGRRGRNATGPILVNGDEKASRAAWRTSPVVMAGGAQGAANTGSYIHCHHKETPSTMLKKLMERRRNENEMG